MLARSGFLRLRKTGPVSATSSGGIDLQGISSTAAFLAWHLQKDGCADAQAQITNPNIKPT
jgi:hypothetical protein